MQKKNQLLKVFQGHQIALVTKFEFNWVRISLFSTINIFLRDSKSKFVPNFSKFEFNQVWQPVPKKSKVENVPMSGLDMLQVYVRGLEIFFLEILGPFQKFASHSSIRSAPIYREFFFVSNYKHMGIKSSVLKNVMQEKKRFCKRPTVA